MTGPGARDAGPTLPPGRVVLVGAVHEAGPALAALLTSPAVDLALVVTAPVEDGGPGPSGQVDLATPAAARGVPVLPTHDANSAEVVAAVAAAEPDLLVVVGWTRLVREPLLAVPRHGCVGFHASLLPRHRGRAPVNWAIARGERITGNTMLMLDADADTGDIVAQRFVHIGPGDTCATVYDRVGRAGAAMLTEHLPALLAGTAPRVRQPRTAGEVLPKRTPGMGIIDWSRTAAELHDWVRALTRPYPGAFTWLDGERVMVWTSRVSQGTSSAPPGTVVRIDPTGACVGTGDGGLLVEAMGRPGEPADDAGLFCRRAGISVGDRFDAVLPEVARWALGRGPRPAGVGA